MTYKIEPEGDANVYRLMKDGNWQAQIRWNGELTELQQKIKNQLIEHQLNADEDDSPPDREHLDASSMDDLCQQILGQSYASSVDDNQGCSMGRSNGTWLCPKLVVDAVRTALDSFNITLDDPEPEQDEEED